MDLRLRTALKASRKLLGKSHSPFNDTRPPEISKVTWGPLGIHKVEQTDPLCLKDIKILVGNDDIRLKILYFHKYPH